MLFRSLAYIACGRLDGFFEQMLQPWDFAAGQIIVKAAGGRFGNWQGNEQNSMLAPSSVLAAGADLFEPLLGILNQHV